MDAAEGKCTADNLQPYDLPLHILAAFVILGASLLGIVLPMISFRSKKWQMNSYLLLVLKAFGTGVILATGFIHMFPPADQNLTSECIQSAWLVNYESWAGVFALLATLGTQFIQTVAILHFSPSNNRVSPTGNDASAVDLHAHVHHSTGDLCANHSPTPTRKVKPLPALPESEAPVEEEDGEDGSNMNNSNNQILPRTNTAESGTLELKALTVANNMHSDNCCHLDHTDIAASHHHRQITAYVLEFGISLHSIIIGLTIGVAREELVGLLVAVSFHQFFEGFALATTAYEAGFKSNWYPTLMCLFYSLTTPFGVAIGIIVAESFMAEAELSLVVMGALDAVSAGILIYDGLVNMLTTNITHNRFFASITTARRVGVFVSLWTGVAAMAVLGMWA